MCLSSLQWSGWLLALTAWHTACNLAQGKMLFKYPHRQAGLCIYGRGTAQQSWSGIPSISPHLWHLWGAGKTVHEEHSANTSAWSWKSNQTLFYGLAVERESLAWLPECHTLRSSCSDCHQEKGKDKPRDVATLQQAVAERELGCRHPKTLKQPTDQRKGCTQ